MASLGLKLYYLRTRRRNASQTAVARELGIRQSLVSQLERDKIVPQIELLLAVCRYYDVSADWLLDEDCGVEPGPADSWSLRVARVVPGMWIEVAKADAHELDGQRYLCRISDGAESFDDAAAELRRSASEKDFLQRVRSAEREAIELERELDEERNAVNRRRGQRRS